MYNHSILSQYHNIITMSSSDTYVVGQDKIFNVQGIKVKFVVLCDKNRTLTFGWTNQSDSRVIVILIVGTNECGCYTSTYLDKYCNFYSSKKNKHEDEVRDVNRCIPLPCTIGNHCASYRCMNVHNYLSIYCL